MKEHENLDIYNGNFHCDICVNSNHYKNYGITDVFDDDNNKDFIVYFNDWY